MCVCHWNKNKCKFIDAIRQLLGQLEEKKCTNCLKSEKDDSAIVDPILKSSHCDFEFSFSLFFVALASQSMGRCSSGELHGIQWDANIHSNQD